MKKSVSIKIAVAALLAAAAVFFALAATRAVFNKKSTDLLSQTAKEKLLSFQCDFNPEIHMALKMIDSAVIKDYMERPGGADEAPLAFKEYESYSHSFLSKSVFWISDADKRYYIDGECLYTLDPALPENSWFPGLLQEKGDYVLLVSYDPALQKTQLWVDAIVRDSDGKATGVTGTGIPLGDFVDKMYTGLDAKISMYFFNDALEVTGAADPSIIEKKLQLSTMLPVNSLDVKASAVKIERTRDGVFVFAPIPVESLGWSLVMFIPYTPREFLSNCAIPVLVILIVALLGFLGAFVKKFVAPLAALQSTVSQISSGNADLTQRINVNTRGMIRQFVLLVSDFNSFLEKLQNSVRSVLSSASSLSDTGKTLAEDASRATSTLERMDSAIARMQEQNTTQDQVIDDMVSSVKSIVDSIERVNKSAENQARSVEDSTQAVKAITDNIESVAGLFEKSGALLDSMVSQTEEGRAKLDAVTRTIEQLAEKSGSILETSEVIQEIAEQTNLLAMNAAIEAAHAGEAGKGFAVVADEIRKLAENSNKEGKRAASVIQESLETIKEMTSAGASMGGAFKKVYELSSAVRDHENSMADAMRTQKASGTDALRAMGAITDASEGTRKDSEMCRDKSDALNQKLSSFDRIIADIREETYSLINDIRLVSASAREMNGGALRNKSNIDSLLSEMNQFTV